MTNPQRALARAIVANETKGVLDAHYKEYIYEIQASACGDWNVIFETAKLIAKTQAIIISFERFKEETLPIDQINRDRYLMNQLMLIMDSMVENKWNETMHPPERNAVCTARRTK